MLFGEHAVVHNYPCIVTAVDQRIKVKAEFNGINELIVNAPQLGIKNYKRNLGLSFVHRASLHKYIYNLQIIGFINVCRQSQRHKIS